MTSVTLKWIALFTMILDHIGAIFFPQYPIIRIIGRLSFPIFAFLLVQGYLKTSSRGKYILRLALFAIIAEIPYDLCFHNTLVYWGSQSIMLELLIGFLALLCLDTAMRKRNYLYLFGTLLFAFLSIISNASYGLYGVAIMCGFYLFNKTRGADVLSLIGLTYLFYGLTTFYFVFLGETYYILEENNTQLYACMAAVPLAIYNGKRGKSSAKWLFYIVYPAHLLLFWAIRYVLQIYFT